MNTPSPSTDENPGSSKDNEKSEEALEIPPEITKTASNSPSPTDVVDTAPSAPPAIEEANNIESESSQSSGNGTKRKPSEDKEDVVEDVLKKIKTVDEVDGVGLVATDDAFEAIDKEQDQLMSIFDESVSKLAEVFQGDDDEDELDESFDISQKLRKMGEISVNPISKDGSSGEKVGDSCDDQLEITKLNDDESDDKRKITNLRKNIREVMDDNQLDASTLAAQRQELERLARVQEQQRIIREVQRQIAAERQATKTQTRVMSLLQGHTSLLKSSSAGPLSSKITLPGSSGTTLMKIPSSSSGGAEQKLSMGQFRGNLTPSVSIAPVRSSTITRNDIPTTEILDSSPLSQTYADDDDDDDLLDDDIGEDSELSSKKDVVTIVDSSDDDCIVLSDDDEEEEEDDDPQNSGLHVNDAYNVPNEQGNVVINIGHPENEKPIYVAPQIARIIKPHQIGGVRFLFDNVIESTDRFDSSTGFGCILAHSMGLGKTLQLVCFCDIFLRHTSSKTVLCIMPINTLQNWVAEFNMWLPEDPEKSPLKSQGEVRPRNFKIFVLNDSHKSLKARSTVVLQWAKEGGILMIGYEMYRLLSLKKLTKKKKKKGKKGGNDDEEEDYMPDAQKAVWDNIHTALVKPGPDLVVCDEGHRIKNSHASISVALKQIRSKRRIVLTGYPLQNNLQEYWCMVDFVRPNYLGSKAEFGNMFERPIQNGQCIDSTPQDIKLMRYRAHVLHSLLLGFVQRRSHAVLQTSLPQKQEYVLQVRMTSFQRKLYDVFMNEVVRKKAVPNPLKAFAVCCKIWNHPDVLYNFLKKREADLDLELAEDLKETVDGDSAKASPVKATTSKPPAKGKGRKKAGEDKNAKPAASISPSNTTSNSVPESNTDVSNSSTTTTTAQSTTEIKQESADEIKSEIKNEITSTPESSMSSYPPSNYSSSGYGSQQSYDSYNPYGTPYNDPYHNNPYGSGGSSQPPMNQQPQGNQNYNYGYSNYQNDYWNQNPNYYSHDYNQGYQNYDPNSYYNNQNNYNSQPYYGHQDGRQHNPQNGDMNYNNNPQQNQWSSDIPPDQHSAQNPQSSSTTTPQNSADDEKSQQTQEIVDLDTKEIKTEMKKEEEMFPETVKEEPPPIKSEESQQEVEKKEETVVEKDEKVESLDKVDVKISPIKDKDDGIPYEWAYELMKGYVPDLIENSPKMELFFCILNESIVLTDRLLVFSQSLLTLNLIEKLLQKNKIPGTEEVWAKNTNYYRLDGSTPAIEREKLINEFNSNVNVHLFLVSTRAGSLGINLVGANRVIVFDASWNPCHDTQAVCRVYRYGQKKPCFVYRLVMDNCLEKRIYDRQVNKQGMSDRVVDECNPDAHLSLKEVTNLCWDDEEETEVKDFSGSKDKYLDKVMQKVAESYWKTLSKEPFQHESLLVDRKEKKLSSAEKRMAQRGYELEKQAAARPTYMYNSSMGTQYRAIRTPDGSIVHRPVASVRPMQADMSSSSDQKQAAARPGGARPTRWIPAEVWQRQGMSAQEMTLPLDVVIPTGSAEKANIVLKAGQKVMVLKSSKGIYMQLESGKIIAIRTAFKMGQNNKDKLERPSIPSPANLLSNLKNNSSISNLQKNGDGKNVGLPPNRAGFGRNVQLGTARPYNMKEFDEDEINDLSKDDDDDVVIREEEDDDVKELKEDDDDVVMANTEKPIEEPKQGISELSDNFQITESEEKLLEEIQSTPTIEQEQENDVEGVHGSANPPPQTSSGNGGSDSDDVIMVSPPGNQNVPPPKPVDNYPMQQQPNASYGLAYGNYPPYYHQQYPTQSSSSHSQSSQQQQSSYYNYPASQNGQSDSRPSQLQQQSHIPPEYDSYSQQEPALPIQDQQQQQPQIEQPQTTQPNQPVSHSNTQISHSVSSMTNQQPPSSDKQDFPSYPLTHPPYHPPYYPQNPQQPQPYPAATYPPQTPSQSRQIPPAAVAEEETVREKAVYKPNLVERKRHNSSSTQQQPQSSPYQQQQAMYQEKGPKASLKNYRHNKSSPNMQDGDGPLLETPVLPPAQQQQPVEPPIPTQPPPMPQQQPPPSTNSSNYYQGQPQHQYQSSTYTQQQQQPNYNQMPPQKPEMKPTSSYQPYQQQVSRPPYQPYQPQLFPPHPQSQSSLSFLEKTASSISENDRNGFQASLSSITRSYSPSPQPYSEVAVKSPAPAKPKRQPKPKKEKVKKDSKHPAVNIISNVQVSYPPSEIIASGHTTLGGGANSQITMPATVNQIAGYQSSNPQVEPPVIPGSAPIQLKPTPYTEPKVVPHFVTPPLSQLAPTTTTTAPSSTMTSSSPTTTSQSSTNSSSFEQQQQAPASLVPSPVTAPPLPLPPTPQVSGSAFHRPDTSPSYTADPTVVPPIQSYIPAGVGYPSITPSPVNPYPSPYTSQYSSPGYPPYGYAPSPYVPPQYSAPPSSYPQLGPGGVPSAYDVQRYSGVPTPSEQYASAYQPGYNFPPYTPQPGQWQ